MTQQVINIGAAPDDSTGDPLRLSFDKTNENFTELYAKGATEGLWNYNQTSTDTTTAPVSGRFKTNSGNYRDATQIAINAITIQGIDRSSTLRTLLVGDLIQCQDSINAAAWCRFNLQSLPVDHGTWFQLNVTLQADGGVASGDNQEIVFVFTASSGSGTAAPIGAEYITSSADATLTAERVLTDTATVTWDRTTAGQIKANATGGSATPVPPQGRLTLQTATPVMTTTQSAKTAIFYTPYIGNQIALYNGTSMVPTTFTELTVATTDTTKSPAAIGASKVNDWFVWNDAGTLRLGHGPDWTNDTTPVGTGSRPGLTLVAGIWTNQATITNGPAASRGTYVGTTRSNASSQLDWIFGGAAAFGLAGWFGVWNCYNRKLVGTTVRDTTSSWSVAPGRIGSLNSSNNNRVSFVSGLAEDFASAIAFGMAAGWTTSVSHGIAIGFDQITSVDGIMGSIYGSNTMPMQAQNSGTGVGFHFFQTIELNGDGVSITYYGNGPNSGYNQTGMSFSFMM